MPFSQLIIVDAKPMLIVSPKPCKPTKKPKCDMCHKAVEKLTEPCGCKEWVCEKKTCESYPSPNCTSCDNPGFVEDSCGCNKPICNKKMCPTVVPPTCSPCERVESHNDECSCKVFSCKPFCIPPTPPTCGVCQTSVVRSDKCGCDVIECVDKPCPTTVTPNC